MRAVRAVLRKDICVIIRVVIGKRNLRVVEHIVNRCFCIETASCRRHPLCDIILVPRRILQRHLKRFVRIVQTGIQDGDNHSFTLVVDSGCVVNTGCINIRIIGDSHLRNRIALREVDSPDAGHSGYGAAVVSADADRNTVIQRGIRVFIGIFQSGSFQLFQKGLLLFCNFLPVFQAG